jgi:hypothetical protein
MTTVGIGLGSYGKCKKERKIMTTVGSYVPSYTNHKTQADADRGHYLTFLLTLTITPQADTDRGHDITFLLTLTLTPQADADRLAWGVMISVRSNVRS